jgi:hypothetical protein
MNKLMEEVNGEYFDCSEEEQKVFILQSLATTFSEDVDFLRKVNKLTFGLTSK